MNECRSCAGTGKCSACGGTGRKLASSDSTVLHPLGDDARSHGRPCIRCDGSGKCPACGSSAKHKTKQ